ncbi:MAG: GYD domain-containing protein [Acidimicrobiales bacterium]|jgi:uncharacterized protein with GYD domain|nr:GYD domain-containing protein [Acidimicrobiales bacterium]
MPVFVMLSTLGPDGALKLRENPNRLKEVNRDVEAHGAKVLHQWGLLGQWDFLSVIEAPDELTMAKVATMLNARGTVKTRTMAAVDVDALIEVLAGTI